MKKAIVKHPAGCLQRTCWIDAGGIEWHPGSAVGVYAVVSDVTYLIAEINIIEGQSLAYVTAHPISAPKGWGEIEADA